MICIFRKGPGHGETYYDTPKKAKPTVTSFVNATMAFSSGYDSLASASPREAIYRTCAVIVCWTNSSQKDTIY